MTHKGDHIYIYKHIYTPYCIHTADVYVYNHKHICKHTHIHIYTHKWGLFATICPVTTSSLDNKGDIQNAVNGF